MNRLIRAVAVGTVGTTLLALFLAVCPCLEMATTAFGEHGCCPPETGLRSAEPGCCLSVSPVPRVVTAPEVFVALASPRGGLPVIAVQTPDDVPTPCLTGPSIFGPPTILRI